MSEGGQPLRGILGTLTPSLSLWEREGEDAEAGATSGHTG